MKNCIRGSVPIRDKYGRCICDKCLEFNRYRQRGSNAKRAEYIKNWQNENKEKVNEYAREWNQRNPEKRKEVIEDWRKRNPDKVKEMNRRAGKKWASNNKGARNAIDMRRKAAKIQRTPKWADLEAIKMVYTEAAKLSKETGIRHEVDHIVPLQGVNVSGLHVHNNLQIITRRDNRSKGNKFNV